MSKNVLDKKIPSFVGLGIIVMGIVFTTFLIKGPTPFQIRANPNSEPKNIQITNVSDSSFTVTYTTDDDVIGTIIYGDDLKKLNQIALDERDQLSQKINEYQAHSITTNNLNPNTNYYFVITSGKKKIKNNNEPFMIKTGSRISSPPTTQIPMAGTIQNANKEPISDGLVIVTINGAQKISGLIRGNGNFTIPLNNLRTSDLGSFFLLDNSTTINVVATSNGQSSKVVVSKNQLSPIPFITLSKNYDFSESIINKPKPVKREKVKFPEFKSEIKEATPTPEESKSI